MKSWRIKHFKKKTLQVVTEILSNCCMRFLKFVQEHTTWESAKLSCPYVLHQLFHFCMLQPFIFYLPYTFSSLFTVVQKEIDNKRTIRSIEKGPILNRKTLGLVKLHSCTQTSRFVQINTFASENKLPGTYCTH